ncbi:hypothetical protein QM565_29685, partial [Geitlerinema splendidum]|nr:hypothetical protein [Geitlerinema splendidum]
DIATPQPNRWVTRIVASQHDKSRVYCSQNGYRQDEWTPYVWVSDDYGKTWRSISANLPFEPVNTVREDPTNKNVLYVGTDMGVYVSIDRGESWMAYGSGIMHTPVHDLAIQPKAKEMVIASHARSVWAVSIDPILKLTEEIRKKEFHEWNVDVPSGRDRWAYDRAPAYADPDYRDREISWDIWTTVRGAGKLELLGSDGVTVVSTDVNLDNGYNFLKLGLLLRKGDPKAPPFTDFDPDDPESALKDPYAARRAVYVAKGEYTLKLTVGGKLFEKKVTIR